MKITDKNIEDQLIGAGVHFAFSKRRRHPSAMEFLSPIKSKNDIFDITLTKEKLDEAKEFVKSLSKEGKTILFVGAKPEARKAIEKTAESAGMPFVTNRWIGGTLTNFPQIKTRVERFESLVEKAEKGELDVYTKKERLLLQKEVEKLSKNFGGLVSMKKLPDALFVIDVKKEHSAVAEALRIGIPVISLSNSDCNIKNIKYPIPGNDASSSSISFIMKEIGEAIEKAKKIG